MTKISVIIPIYNGEQHLKQCLDSICNQTMSDIEIICIDDGSSDNSQILLKEYSCHDKRIKVITQEHQCAGIARNNGLKNAYGDYVIFWDCDDYFALDCLEKMYLHALNHQADVCVCAANHHYMDLGCVIPSPKHLIREMLPLQEPFSKEDIPYYIFNFTSISAWNKLVRKDFLTQNGISFGETKFGEDIFFTIQVFALAKSIVTVPEYLITYRTGQGDSLVDHISEYINEIIETWIAVADKFKKDKWFPCRSFNNCFIENILFLIQHTTSWDSVYHIISTVKDHMVSKFNIVCDDGYYHKLQHQYFVKTLLSDSAEECLNYISKSNFKEARLYRVQNGLLAYENNKYLEEIHRLKTEKNKLVEENLNRKSANK